MDLAHCILGKFLGVVCHCFPPPLYCCPNRHRSTSIFHSWDQAFRIIGCLGRSPNLNPTSCWEQREGRLIWPYYVFPIIRLQVLWSSHHLFRLLALFSVMRCLAITVPPWMLDLWSSRQTALWKRGLQDEYWVLLSPLLQQFYDFQTQAPSICGDPFHLVWFSGPVPISWWRLPTICVCRRSGHIQ